MQDVLSQNNLNDNHFPTFVQGWLFFTPTESLKLCSDRAISVNETASINMYTRFFSCNIFLLSVFFFFLLLFIYIRRLREDKSINHERTGLQSIALSINRVLSKLSFYLFFETKHKNVVRPSIIIQFHETYHWSAVFKEFTPLESTGYFNIQLYDVIILILLNRKITL